MLVVVTRVSLRKQNSQALLTLYLITYLISGKKLELFIVVAMLPNPISKALLNLM
jgi:hypothetical protein